MTVARSPILFTVEQIAGKKNTRVLCKYLTTGNNRAEIRFIIVDAERRVRDTIRTERNKYRFWKLWKMRFNPGTIHFYAWNISIFVPFFLESLKYVSSRHCWTELNRVARVFLISIRSKREFQPSRKRKREIRERG